MQVKVPLEEIATVSMESIVDDAVSVKALRKQLRKALEEKSVGQHTKKATK